MPRSEPVDPLPPDPDLWETAEFLCRGSIAMLARSPELRTRAKAMAPLRGLAGDLALDHPFAGYLAEIIETLDGEELLVLHPEQRAGFIVRLYGIADNFQLQTLLADALIGDPFDGWLAGVPVDYRVVAAAKDQPADDQLTAEGRFDLFRWRAVQADGSLPPGLDGADFWIWGEGRPADLEKFEGRRVLLLAPPCYSRTWTAARRFDAMAGRVEVVTKLDRDTVRDWISRLASNRGT